MLRKVSPCCTIFCGISAVGVFVFAFFAASVINGVLFKQAAQNVVLKPETFNKWGSVPGSTNTFVFKNYSFFNFTNPSDFAYFNKTAKVIQTPSFDYQEYQNLLDVNYTNNSAGVPIEVSFHHQKYNVILPTTNDLQNRTVPNLGPMGVWSTARSLGYDSLGMTAFAVLQSGLTKTLYSSVLSKGIRSLNMKDQAGCNSQILDKVVPELTDDQKNAIWFDTLYGMNDTDTFSIWMTAAQDGYLSGAGSMLKDYFQLSNNQLAFIIGKPMKDWITNLHGVLANWYNCTTTPCDPKYLGALQWTQQGVSNNPPKTSNASGPDPFPSIASVNKTASGFPEISYYMKGFLLKNNFTGNVSDYENITFSTDFGIQILNGTNTDPYPYPKAPTTLLNIKNYDFVLKTGEQFENNGGTPSNLIGIKPIQDRWNLPSLQHAYVFYKYCRYFIHEFAIKEDSMNGTKGFLAMGKFGSQNLYEKFDKLKSFLFMDFLSRGVLQNIKQDNLSCAVLLNNSLAGASDTLVNQICSIPQLQQFDLNSVKFLTSVCRYEQQYSYQVLVATTNITKTNLMALCQNIDVQTLAGYIDSNQVMLNTHYGCSNISRSCSDFEFAAMQWGSSNITMNIPPALQSQFPGGSAGSVADLYPSDWRKPIEFLPILRFLSPNFPDFPVQGLQYPKAIKYLNFLSLWSPSVVQKAFLLNRTQDYENFTKTYGFDNPIPLLSYLRFVIIEHAFDGLAQTRHAKDLIYGYTDRVLNRVNTDKVVEGGNPSINSVIAVGGQNSSVEDARQYFQATVYTGADDVKKVKQYKEVQHKPYITYNCSSFDGMDITVEDKSPWKVEIPISGTDSTLNAPNVVNGTNFTVFVTDIYFIGSSILKDYSIVDVKGLKTYKLGIDNYTFAAKNINPGNGRYYSEKYQTALNLTKAKMLPMFITKQYFLDADWDLVKAVEIYNDTNMTQRIYPSRDYDLNMFVEPTTGASLKADQRLQLNLYFEPDELFPNVQTSMVPILFFYRGFEFNDATINSLFKPLKIGFAVRDNSLYIFMGVAGLLLLMTVCCGCIWKKKRNAENEEHEYVETDDPHALLIGNKRNPSSDKDSVTQI